MVLIEPDVLSGPKLSHPSPAPRSHLFRGPIELLFITFTSVKQSLCHVVATQVRASDISRKKKQNFAGFSGANSRKNRPISREKSQNSRKNRPISR